MIIYLCYISDLFVDNINVFAIVLLISIFWYHYQRLKWWKIPGIEGQYYFVHDDIRKFFICMSFYMLCCRKNTTIYNIQMYSVVYFYPMNTLTSSKCCLHSHAPPIYLSIKLVISHIYVYLRFSDLIYKRVYVHSHVKQRDRKFINNTSIVLKWDQIKFNNTTLISAFSK